MVTAAIAAGNYVLRSGGPNPPLDQADPVVDVLLAAQQLAEGEINADAAVVRPGWQYHAAATRSDAFTGSPVGARRAFPLSIAGLGIHTDPVYWDSTVADVIVADWDNVLIGVRQDLTFEFSNSAVIQDETGAITNNMWTRDSTAMRCVMRVGYHLAQPANGSNTRGVPVSVVVPSGPAS
jgi:hypothetical protein